jgi:hypothetical protein
LNKNVWKSFINNHINISGCILRKSLNKDQNVEYNLLKSLSKKLIIDNYNRDSSISCIKKKKNGYFISRRCYKKQIIYCTWNININIKKNEASITYNKSLSLN